MWICYIELYKKGIWVCIGEDKDTVANQAWDKLIDYASEDGLTLPVEYEEKPNLTLAEFKRVGVWDCGECLGASLHEVSKDTPTYLFDNGRL